MGTFAKPYLAGIALNLHEHIAKGIQTNSQGRQIPVIGKQKPALTVEIDLYLSKRNVGRQTYSFLDKPQPETKSHKGLPVYSDVLSPEIVKSWEEGFGSAIDVEFPEYFDDSKEAKASGPAIYPRINRIEAAFPFNNPADRYVAAIIGLYEDPEFTRQIINADFVVAFNQDESITSQVRQQFGLQPDQELTSEMIAQVRRDLMQYSLKDFVSNPAMQQSIGTMAASVFSVLKSQVYQWSEIDVATIMQSFSIPVE